MRSSRIMEHNLTRGLCFVAALAVILIGTAVAQPVSSGAGAQEMTLADLPLLGQYAISKAMGKDQPAYHVVAADKGFRAVNAENDLKADFQSGGTVIQAGSARLGLRLVGFGSGDAVKPVEKAGKPVVSANRIEFERGPLTEWFVNGPLGLQQGFTVDRAPEGEEKNITLVLELEGDLVADVDADGTGLTLRDSQGVSRLRYAGLTAYDATGRTLGAELATNGGEIRIRVETDGAQFPIVIDPILQNAKLLPSDGLRDDEFGRSVSISGDTLVVGAWGDDDKGTDSGSAYVFVKPAGGWSGALTQTAKLVASDGSPFDRFGYSVAISGGTVVVGANRDDDKGTDSGSAYVFVKPAGGWSGTLTQTAKLVATSGANYDLFGSSVSISGDTIVVGATGGEGQGASYVFLKPTSGWSGTLNESAKLLATDGNVSGGDFGGAVSICVNTVVVGACAKSFGSKRYQGAAYVFLKPKSGWSGTLNESAKLLASDGESSDFFGRSASISGDTVAVGANGTVFGGKAYVFVKPTGGWSGTLTENAQLVASKFGVSKDFGYSISVSGDIVAVGDQRSQEKGGGSSGAVYVFVKPVGGWSGTCNETAKLLVSDGAVGDYFGCSVSVSGDTLVAGAYGDDDKGPSSGSAVVFERPSEGWSRGLLQPVKLVANDGEKIDYFGYSVSISGDTLVVGAQGDDGFKGSAYVFVKPSGGWSSTLNQSAKLVATDGAASDYFGISVSISGDTVVVGAYKDDDKGTDSGSAYVFVKPAGGWSGTLNESAKLLATKGAASDYFGRSVSISGDTVVVGASRGDGQVADSGSAYVYVKPAGGWSSTLYQIAKLNSSDGATYDYFGVRVSIDKDMVVIGASGDDDKGSGSGSAYVFVKPAGGWSSTLNQSAKLLARDGAAGDSFGNSVSISGDTVVVGACQGDGMVTDSGSAYVFVKPAGGWTGTLDESAKLLASDGEEGDYFGFRVSIDRSTVLIGAYRDGDLGLSAGAAYVFAMPPGGWSSTLNQSAKLLAKHGTVNDNYGSSVSIGGNALVVGAMRGDGKVEDSGAVYVRSLVQLTGFGTPRPGKTFHLGLTALPDTGLAYQLGSSLGTGPTPIDTRQIGLSADALLWMSLSGLFPTLFSNYAGFLDAQGTARAALNIPDESALIGYKIHSAFVTLSGSAPSGIKSISGTCSFEIKN